MDKPTAEDLLPPGFDDCVLQVLEANPEGVSEFAMLKHLAHAFPDSLFATPGALGEPLQLFQLHFLLFHRLYALSDHLAGSRRELAIHALCIRLLPRQTLRPDLTVVDPLRAYYLDWNQWLQTSADDVRRLLDEFWRNRPAPVTSRQLQWAREVIGVGQGEDMPAIKRRYRRLMMLHHPDRGGDGERGSEINQAYLILNRYYREPRSRQTL